MTNATTLETLHQPILVELDEQTWDNYLNRTAAWLNNVLTLQAAFREMAENVHRKLEEPHFKELIGAIAERAKGHEQQAETLFQIIDREPGEWRKSVGTMTAKARELWADLVGSAGEASEPWRDMQQLHISSLNAMSAFAAAEQLGYSLAMPELSNRCFDIVAGKYADHLLLQELILEAVPWGILYQTKF